MKMNQKIKAFVQDVINTEDHEGTWILDLETHNGKRWALVAAWMDYDCDDAWKVYAKLAYQPTDSLMQEYDIDWLMPIDENGDVDDTELFVGSEPNDSDIGWWLKNWEYYKENYVYKENEEDE